jgi:hypothetical protein
MTGVDDLGGGEINMGNVRGGHKSRVLVLACMLLIGMTASAGEESSNALWLDKIKDKPNPRILDDFEILPMTCFRAVPDISDRSAALADVIFYTNKMEVIHSSVHLPLMTSYAEHLKGESLSGSEEAKVKALYAKLQAEHDAGRPKQQRPDAVTVDVTFALGDVRSLHRTIEKCKTLEEAVARIERLHGYSTVLECEPKATFDSVRKSIHMSMPVLLEDMGGGWRVCCGYIVAGGKEYVLLNTPSKTPLMKGPGHVLPQELDSKWPEVRRAVAYQMTRGKVTGDFEISSDIVLPGVEDGFVFSEFKDVAAKAYYVHPWKRSALPLRADLMKIVGREEVASEDAGRVATDGGVLLWEKHFKGRGATVLANAKLTRMWCIRSGHPISRNCAVFASVTCGRYGPAVGDCVLDEGLFHRAARDLIGGWEAEFSKGGRELSMAEQTALEKLCNDGHQAYNKAQRAVRLDYYCDYAAPYHRAAMAIAGSVSAWEDANKEKDPGPAMMLSLIGRTHGWEAILEGGKALPFGKYREAIEKGIPILLVASKDPTQWRIGCGYLTQEKKAWILVVNPEALPNKEVLIADDQPFPTSGVRMEAFAEKDYIPYFIYGWKRSVSSYSKEIAEIMKNHPKPSDKSAASKPETSGNDESAK